MERKNSISALAGVGECWRLLNILTKEGTQVLYDLVQRLRNVMVGTELNKTTDRHGRASLKI